VRACRIVTRGGSVKGTRGGLGSTRGVCHTGDDMDAITAVKMQLNPYIEKIRFELEADRNAQGVTYARGSPPPCPA